MNLRPLLFVAFALLGSSAAASPPPPALRSDAPLCSAPSHSVLVVQKGRDVCGPAMLPSGPVSVGFLPTACPKGRELAVDASKDTDICRKPPPPVPH